MGFWFDRAIAIGRERDEERWCYRQLRSSCGGGIDRKGFWYWSSEPTRLDYRLGSDLESREDLGVQSSSLTGSREGRRVGFVGHFRTGDIHVFEYNRSAWYIYE